MTLAAILGLSGPRLTSAERDFFRSADPFGFILFARNVETPAQLRQLTGDLRDCVGRDALIAVDQEGGRVQRLRAPHWSDWSSPLEDAAHGAQAVRLRYRLIARELRSVGIDCNCAPTLDIAGEATHPFLRDRCLGHTPREVAAAGRAAAEGMLAEGVLPVIKHMPGHGRATADSHLETPVVSASAETLRGTDFLPFRDLADLPLGMSAHVRFTALDDRPGTVSPVVVGLIRDEIGFDGLLMTDDIGMGGLAGSIAERSRDAVAAGCDVVLHCSGSMDEMVEVAEAAGPLTAEARRRAASALARRRASEAEDDAALRAAYAALRTSRSDAPGHRT